MTFETLLAKKRADFVEATAPKPTVIALNTRGANPVIVTQVESIRFEKVLNDMGSITLTVVANPVNCAVFADVHPDATIPVIVQVGFLETVWFASHVTEKIADGEYSLVVEAVSPEKALHQLFAWPNPNLLPEAQISKVDVAAGPVATLVKDQILRPNLARMGRKTGGQVHYVAPFATKDTYTRSTIIGLKMDNVLEAIQNLLDSEGLTLSYSLYLPGRGQTPPAGHDPQRAAVIWDVEQRATLPAGGLVWHGLMRSAADFWQDTWDTLTGFTDYGASPEAVDYWGQPQQILRASQYDDVEITTVKPSASTFTVGGKSQDMLNDAISAGIRGLLSMVPPPFNIALDIFGLDDVMDDRLFAYHSFDDRSRRERMGPFGLFETFSPSVGLSLDAVMLMRQAQYRSRATRSHEVRLGGSAAFTPGEEFDVGTMLALELPRDRFTVAFVTRIAYTYNVDEDSRWDIQVSDRPRRDPIAAFTRALNGLGFLANKLLLVE